MAQYDISYSCGHRETKALFGKEDGRQSYIAWAEKYGSCTACQVRDKAAALAAFEAEHHLPDLEGSEKQIAWATTIRRGLIRKAVAQVEKRRATVQPGAEARYEESAGAVLTALCGQAAARWWIDMRREPIDTVMTRAWKG